MRVAVCGSVAWTAPGPIEAALDELLANSDDPALLMVLTGMAEGADEIARTWAADRGVTIFAERLDDGPYPGPMHTYNERLIAMRPDLVLAFKAAFDPSAHRCDGRPEPGTEHLVRRAIESGIETLVFRSG